MSPNYLVIWYTVTYLLFDNQCYHVGANHLSQGIHTFKNMHG